jgi:hypothetical protein
MNQIILKAFSAEVVKQDSDINTHLWTQLLELSRNIPSTLEEKYYPVSQDLKIQFAEKGKRARQVVRRSNYRQTGKFPSPKNGRMMHWESQYEKMAFQLLEIAPFVVSYQEQPAIFKFTNYEGCEETHFPDIFVELLNGRRLFIEIKSNGSRGDSKLDNRTMRLQELVIKKDYRYLVIFPDQIDSFYYLDNAQSLLRYSINSVSFPIKEKVKLILSQPNDVTYSSLIQQLDNEKASALIYRLIIEGFVSCDLSQPISNQTNLVLQGELK